MKSLAVVVLVLATLAIAYAEDKYTNKYDNVDLDEIIKNKRLLKNYVNCLLEKGKCSPDGLEVKKVIPDALQTQCSKCSERQQNGVRKILRHLIDHEQEWWNELEKKYDPEGTYRKRYQEEARKEGFNV